MTTLPPTTEVPETTETTVQPTTTAGTTAQPTTTVNTTTTIKPVVRVNVETLTGEVVTDISQLNIFWPKAIVDLTAGVTSDNSTSLAFSSGDLPTEIGSDSYFIIQPKKAGWGTPGKKTLRGVISTPFKRAFLIENDEGNVRVTTTTEP